MALLVAVSAPAAHAQSAATVESVRLRRSEALKLAQGELTDCLASSCPRASHLSLLIGYLLLAEGNATEAVQQLSSHAPPALLASFHAFYLGEAQFYAQDKQAAAKSFHLAAEEAPAWLRARARTREAEALLAAGDVAAAAPLLERAASETPSPELLCQRAIARAAVGAREAARADWRQIALRHPIHPCAAGAQERLVEADGRPYRFNFDERLLRARAFMDGGDPKGALAELESASGEKVARAASTRARLALIRAGALFALGRDNEAEQQVDETARGPAGVAADGLLLRARRALRANDNARARSTMAQIDSKYPREAAAEEAGYFVGWLDLQAGRLSDAVKAFSAFAARHPRARRRDEALWFQSLALLLDGKHAEARNALQELWRQFPKSSLVPQARYWATRSSELAESSDGALLEGYEQILRTFPGSFYALLASARLRALGREPSSAFTEPPKTVRAPPPSELNLASALAEAGLVRDASEEVQQRLDLIRSAPEAVRFGHALQQMGEYGHAYALAARLLWANAYTKREGEALALLYPRAYPATVEREAKERNLDPFLIWAVMRRESAFRLEAVSTANARGLMMIFPPTASAISRKLEIDPPEPDQLFSAELNVRFAAWYLAELKKRFAHPALCAAAYNAGPGPVVRWVQDRGSLPLDLFVERIPYKETRAYVKQVVADYFTYHELYGDRARWPRLELALPTPAAGVSF